MPEIEEKSLTVVQLFQKWMSTRNPLEIGTKFLIDGQDKTIVLVECEGYPNGKFIYDNGDDFDIAKNGDYKFVQLVKTQDEKSTFYDDDIWNAFDTARNGTPVIAKDENGKLKYDKYGNPIYEIMKDDEGKDIFDDDGNPIYVKEPFKIKDKEEKKPIILKGFGKEQVNESYHDIAFYDVTEIIKEIINHEEKMEQVNNPYFNNYNIKNLKEYKNTLSKVMKYLQNNNYPVLAKERLYYLLKSCQIEPTKKKDILKVKKDGIFLGYLIGENNRCMFVPKNKKSTDEYSFENNQALGFYYTADSYLDIALESIKDYNEKFMILHHNDPNKNKDDPGYQASSTIKTLLAFSCECYLKSLLINNGMKINELKDLGHSIVNLFASLDGKLLARVFDFMQRRGYSINNSLYEPVYESGDLTDKFMMDLAKNDNAFEDSRYSAEFEKNTDYSFLYKFALALRNCSSKEYSMFSPFTEFIDENISRNQK